MDQEILDKIAERDEILTNKIKEMCAGNEALETRLKEMEALAAPKRKLLTIDGLEKEEHKFSFCKAINAIATNDWSEAGFEKEIFQETKLKTMGTNVDSAGGFIVPTQVLGEMINMLMAKTVVIESGATVLDNLYGSPVEVPKQTGGATAYWVGENESITASDIALGQIQMTPKAVAALVKLSNRLLRMSSPSVETMVRNDIVKQLALKIDAAALRGTGTQYQPLGVLNAPDINTVVMGATGGTPNFDTLIDMEYAVEEDNALDGNLGFIFHPAIRRQLIKTKVPQFTGQEDGSYVVQPVSDSVLASWIGYPYKTTTQIPITGTKSTGTNLSEIYFGNWSDLVIGQWAGMAIKASQETSTAFEKDQTWIRIIQEVDTAIRHGESFCVCTDAKAA